MAIRVRKLAKQLGRNPVELLGILKTLGIQRYKSPEDMLSNPVEAKLRSAVSNGVKPTVVVPERVRKVERKGVEPAPAGLFEGVEREVDDRFVKDLQPAAASRPTPLSAVSLETPPEPVSVIDKLAPSRSTEAEHQALVAERRAITAQREALAAERAALEAARRVPSSTALADVLAARGLHGQDEFERAIRTLAENRRLAEIIPFLAVTDVAHVKDWLANVLILVDGPPPEALQREALVTVGTERAEIPGAATFRRLTTELSERLLLNGLRRVLVVGGPVRGHRLMAKALDPRIEIRFRPARTVVAVDAETDVTRVDAVALWNVDVDDGAAGVYASGRALVARIDTDRVGSFIQAWARSLDA